MFSNCNGCCNCSPEARIIRALTEMEQRMATAAEEFETRIRAALDNVRGDVQRQAAKITELTDRVEEVLVEKQVAVDLAIRETLDGLRDVAEDLESLAAETPEDEEPPVEEPPAEEPPVEEPPVEEPPVEEPPVEEPPVEEPPVEEPPAEEPPVEEPPTEEPPVEDVPPAEGENPADDGEVVFGPEDR